MAWFPEAEFIDFCPDGTRVIYTQIQKHKGTYLYRMDLINTMPTLVTYKVFTLLPKQKLPDRIPDGLVYSNFGLALQQYDTVIDAPTEVIIDNSGIDNII